MAKVNYINTKSWSINSNANPHTLYLSDVWSPPAGGTFQYSQVTWTFTNGSSETTQASIDFLKPDSSYSEGYKRTTYATYHAPAGATITVTWRGEGDNFNGTSASTLALFNTSLVATPFTDGWGNVIGYSYEDFPCSGSLIFTVCWQVTVTVTKGDTITKEHFDNLGWTATREQPISHSGYSGTIYASTYNNTNLVTTKNGGSYSGGTA